MRISRGRGDHRDDAGGGCGDAAGDASLASAPHDEGLIDEVDDGAFVAVEETDKLAEIR